MNQRPAIDPSTTETDRIGFFGKLPTHGDFVATGLHRAVQDALDTWLRSGMGKAQHHAGDRWDSMFRAMPTWRFVIERDIWGPCTIAGVIAPSRDRVGRRFPLVIAAQLHEFADDARKICLDDTWFIALEAIAETTQRRDFQIDAFTASLKRLRSLRPGDFDFPDPQKALRRGPDTLWWRFDSEDRQNKGFRSGGAPRPEDFVELMASATEVEPSPSAQAPRQEEPRAVPQQTTPAAESEREQAPLLSVGRFEFTSSQASHPGTRLSLNADVVLAQHLPTLFAVIDGVGDGSDAGEASRTTTAMLRDCAPQETLESLVQEVKGKLGRAHSLLQSVPGLQERTPPSASLVTLLTVGGRFALLWAGDARAYLVRDGMMRALTRDHVAVGLRRSLSRGIGMRGQLSPEVLVDMLQDRDRFLLCSNPLTRVVPERSIAEILISADLAEAATALIQEGLVADCRENLSAVVIDIKSCHER